MVVFIDSDVWALIINCIVAIFVGVPGGYLLSFWIRRSTDNKERNELYCSLYRNLTKNIQLMEQMSFELPKGGTIYYNLDLSNWPIFLTKIRLIEDRKLADDTLYIYYELIHLSRKVDLQLNEFFLSALPGGTNPNRTQLVMGGIVSHIGVLKPKVQDLQVKYQHLDP